MTRALRVLIILSAIAGVATPAFAVPAPMSDQELMDKSDLVAEVRVLSVTCTTVTQDPTTGEDAAELSRSAQSGGGQEGRRQAGRRGAGDVARHPQDHRGTVDGLLLSGRRGGHPSHQAERRGDLCLDLVERQGRRSRSRPTRATCRRRRARRSGRCPSRNRKLRSDQASASSQSLNTRRLASLAAGAKRAVSARILPRSTFEVASSSV